MKPISSFLRVRAWLPVVFLAAIWLAIGPVCYAQTPAITRVVDTFSGTTATGCPGAAMSIFGTQLGPAQANRTVPNPVSVTINGRPAYVYYSQAAEVDVQLPTDLPTGPATLVLQYQSQSSAPFPLQIATVAPGLAHGGLFARSPFGGGAGGDVADPVADFFRAGTSGWGSLSNPAGFGEQILLYAGGLGVTNPSIAAGAPQTPLAQVAAPITVRLRGQPLELLYAGVIPGLAWSGLYQLNIKIPASIPAGLHPLTITVGGATSNTVMLPIGLGGLALTQSGFTFQAVQGGGTPAPEIFRLLNQSGQRLNYALTSSTLSGGPWLNVSPLTGSIAPDEKPSFAVSVNPAGLAPGDYYGSIEVSAAGAVNSPLTVSVVLNVSPATVNPGPTVRPTGLVFGGTAGGTNPAPQQVTITNVTNRPSAFTVTGQGSGVPQWFTFSPAAGNVAPNTPLSISVQPNLTGLAAGTYRGTLVLTFPQDGATRSIDLLLVVRPPGSSAAPTALAAENPAADGNICVASKLLPVFTLLGSAFVTSVAWPTPIEVFIVDDCTAPMTEGVATVTFSNGDKPLSLTPRGEGHWSGTWAAVNPRPSSLAVVVDAKLDPLQGTAQVGGSAAPNPEVPVIQEGSMVNAGSYSATATPSPGELVSLFGLHLADGFEQAGSLPLATRMQNAVVTLNGKRLPLVFASEVQINAQIPYGLPTTTTQQLVVQRGNRLSLPQPVNVAVAQPAVFSTDLTGKGQGHIYVAAGDQQTLADRSAPATAGDYLVIYCTGLGAVAPAVTAGAAVPADELRYTSNPVSVTAGGVALDVKFAGLTPGLTGLYQVNAIVGASVPKGDAVPVVITVAGGLTSPPVTMAVK